MMEIKLPMRVSEMLKRVVENRSKEKLGKIEDFMVGVDGRLKYAILSHGGFLGIGDVLIPVPYEALMTGDEKGTAVLDIDKSTLEKALNFESKTWPDFTCRMIIQQTGILWTVIRTLAPFLSTLRILPHTPSLWPSN